MSQLEVFNGFSSISSAFQLPQVSTKTPQRQNSTISQLPAFIKRSSPFRSRELMCKSRGLAQPQKHFHSIDKQLAKRAKQQQRDRRAIARLCQSKKLRVMQTVTSPIAVCHLLGLDFRVGFAQPCGDLSCCIMSWTSQVFGSRGKTLQAKSR